MKKLSVFCMTMLIILCEKVYSQTLIAADDFENALTLFGTSGTPVFYSGNSAAGDRPESSPFLFQNTYALGVTNGTLTLTSDLIDISAYTSAFMSFKLAAFSINNVSGGMENTDIVNVSISPDGGFTYYQTIRVIGNSNAYWSYTGGTGNASTPYDGNINTVGFGPAAGGNRITDGFSTVTVTNLPQVANLRVRIAFTNNAASERWLIDNFEVRGTAVTGPLVNIYPFALAAFSSTTGVPAAEQTYEVRGSNLTNNIIVTAPAGFQVSTSSGAGFGPTVTLTQSGGSVPNTTIYARMNSVTAGNNSGNISNASAGATIKNVSVSGNVFATEPTVASTVSLANITGTSMDVNFSGGNGAGKIVVMRLGSAITAVPVDGMNYNGNSVFAFGSSLGFSQYIVYKGAGSTVNVTGLNSNSNYHVAVFEYNDAGVFAATNYFTTPGVANTNTSVIAEGLEITATNTLFQIDFDNTVARVNDGPFAGVSFSASPTSGQLNSNAWAINGAVAGGPAIFGSSVNTGGGISAGNVTPGTFYAFEPVMGNRALGIQPTDSYMTPGSIILRLQNNTGAVINTLAFAYTVFVLNNENLGTAFRLEYSTDNLNYNNIFYSDTSIVIGDAIPAWKAYLRSSRLTGLSVPNGNHIYLRWMFDDPILLTGSRDEFALDDIRIVAEPVNVFPRASGNYENMKITGPIQLDGNTTVANDINLIGHNIELGNNNITIGGSVTSSGSAYLQTNGTGTVTLNNVTTARLFPVGVTTYNPVTIGNGSGLNWTVRVDNGIANVQPPLTTENAVLRTWTITPSVNPPPAGADLTFGYNDGDLLQLGPNYINTEDVQVWHYDGTNWTAASAAITPGGTVGNLRTVTLSDWSEFSSFAITNFSSTLPVEFGLVKAIQTDRGIKITWENLTESDVLSYYIERSKDGQQFMVIGQINPLVNDGGRAIYDWLDTSPYNGLNFYRIRVIETGGKIIYSKILTLDILKQQLHFSVLPNPVRADKAYLNFSNVPKDNYIITLFSTNGQPVFKKSIFHQGGSAILPFQLTATIKPGTYIIQLEGKEVKLISKLVIQ